MRDKNHTDRVRRLVPAPQKVLLQKGNFAWDKGIRIILEKGNENDRTAAETLRKGCAERGMAVPEILYQADREIDGRNTILAGDPCRHLLLFEAMTKNGIEIPPEIGDDGYILHITPSQILIAGNTAPGIYYGFQTLIQLLPEKGERGIPCLSITDWTTLRHRGISMDFARGQFPKPKFVKQIIGEMAHYKLNMLVLYLENAFVFPSHPNIGKDRDRLTTEEAWDLDAFAKKHHVMLIPCLDSPGHLERFLAEPDLAHLAEGAEPEHFKNVINVTHPETYPLLRDLYTDMARAFPAPLFMIAGDEALALGKGKSKNQADKFGADNLYIRHIKILHEILGNLGKRILVAGDPFEPDFFKAFGIENYGLKALSPLPRDIIILPWHYNRVKKFEFGDQLNRLGFDMHLWASFCDYNGFFPETGTALENISSYVPYAHRLNALGALCSGWGDRNTFRENNWPLAAFFAEHAWRKNARQKNALFPIAAERFFGPGTAPLTKTHLFLGNIHRYFGWAVIGLDSPGFRMFYNPMEPRKLTEEEIGLLSEFRRDAKEARKSFERARANASRHRDFLDFVEFALDQFEVMGDLVECRHLLAKNDSESRRKFQILLKKVSASVASLHKRYQKLWHRSRRPKGLKPNNRNFEKLKGSIENLLKR